MEILGRTIALKARSSQLYLRLAEAFQGDAEAARFWLDRSLNESNHANLLGFFRGHAREAHIGAEAAQRYLAQSIRREAAMEAAEKSLAREPLPFRRKRDPSGRWIWKPPSTPLSWLKAWRCFFQKVRWPPGRSVMACRVICASLGELALQRAPDVRARERAEALLSMAQQIKSSSLTP